MTQEAQDKNSCSMVGLLGILIQIGLGILSFSVLIVKRYFQNPKRPWKIWTFDASKQIISQLIAHFINLTISLALTYGKQNSDECLWYFVTNVFDNTMGVFICIILLKVVQNNLRKNRKFQLISGNYYRKIDPLSLTNHNQTVIKSEKVKTKHVELVVSNGQRNGALKAESIASKKQYLVSQGDPRMPTLNAQQVNFQKQRIQSVNQNQQQLAQDNFIYIIDYRAWIKQVGIWNAIVIIGKCALFGLQFGLDKQLQDFSLLILGWIEDYPVLQLLLVMVLVPVIMNGFAYWIQDNFLMKHDQQVQQKNLIQQNLKENLHVHDQIQSHQYSHQKYQKSDSMNQRTRPRKQSQFQDNGNRFEFHDDYDAKDEQNPVSKFDNFFEKFGKFAM